MKNVTDSNMKLTHDFERIYKDAVYGEVNKNSLDNRKKSLRSKSKVAKNKTIIGRGSSKYLGVSKVQNRDKWQAILKNKKLGTYQLEIEAAFAYDLAALKEFGGDAKINGITEEQLNSEMPLFKCCNQNKYW